MKSAELQLKNNSQVNTVVIIGIFVFSLLVRLVFLRTVSLIESDGCLYARLAENIISGKGMVGMDGSQTVFIRPLYPLLIAVANKIIGNLELSGRVITIFFGSVTPVIVYLITKKLFGKTEGILAALLTAVSPVLISSSIQVMTETVYMSIIISGIFCLFLALKGKSKSLVFASGLVWGMAYLTRSEGFGFLILCLLAILFINLLELPFKSRVIFASCFVSGAAILILPMVVYLHSVFDIWNLSGEYIYLKNIGYFQTMGIKTYLRNLYYHAYLKQLPSIFAALPTAILGVGLFRSLAGENKARENILLGIFVMYFFLFYPWFTESTISARHYLPILPILYIWVAKGITEIAEWFSRVDNGISKPLIIVFFVSVLFMGFLPRLAAPWGAKDKFLQQPLEYKIVGNWIKDNLGDNQRIMSRIREVAYYAHSQLVLLPKEQIKYPDLISLAREENIDYIILDKRWTARVYPWISSLVDEKDKVDGLELIYKWEERPEYKVVVYKIKRRNNEIH